MSEEKKPLSSAQANTNQSSGSSPVPSGGSKAADFFLECEKHWCFWLLIIVGGYYGAYTYTLRGGVFCNAQTGNVVMLAMALGTGDWGRFFYLLIPISAYFMGAFVSEILESKVKELHFLRWDTMLVGLEIPMVIFLGLLPESAPDQICQVMINFVCSMRFNTFRQNEGVAMATVFVTSHIRQTGSLLAKAVWKKDHEAAVKCRKHATMILMFIIGGVLSAFLCARVGLRAIWGCLPILIYTFVRLCIADRIYERDYFDRMPHGY